MRSIYIEKCCSYSMSVKSTFGLLILWELLVIWSCSSFMLSYIALSQSKIQTSVCTASLSTWGLYILISVGYNPIHHRHWLEQTIIQVLFFFHTFTMLKLLFLIRSLVFLILLLLNLLLLRIETLLRIAI